MKINFVRQRSDAPQRAWSTIRDAAERRRLTRYEQHVRVAKWSIENRMWDAHQVALPVGALVERRNRRMRPAAEYKLGRLIAAYIRMKDGRELTPAQREIVIDVLRTVSRDEDAREVFWETVKHRPSDGVIHLHIATLVALARLEGASEKAAKLDVQQRWSVTGDQMKHALKRSRAEAEYIVSRVRDNEGLKRLASWQMDLHKHGKHKSKGKK